MKKFGAIILFVSLSISVFGQSQDSVRIDNDTISFETTNAFITNEKNYETINNSFITGNSFGIIRSQDNLKVLVDGMPMNPVLYNNTHYSEFLGSMHLLSFDIQKVNFKTIVSDDKIISGYYNNALDFRTHDIKLGNAKPQFEVNNFTALEYQDLDANGYSTITNFSAQQSYEKFGYRFSLNNGFQNDYIPENGLQRYSGNIKLKYKPNEKIFLIGFLDYSNFQNLKRSQENILKSNRLMTYIDADISLTHWFHLFGKYGFNNVSDVSQRSLKYNGEYYSGGLFSESYIENNDYKYKSSYLDFGVNFNKSVTKTTLLTYSLGFYLYSNIYFSEYESNYQLLNEDSSYGNSSRLWSKSEPKTKEKVLYTSLKLNSKFLTIKYIFNRTNYIFNYNFSPKGNENKTFSNHVVSSNLTLIKNDDKMVNKLGFQLNYGKLINYSINQQPVIINLPGYSQPEWVTKFDNDNIEFNLYSSFLRHRIGFNFLLYKKIYSSYSHLFQFIIWDSFISSVEDIGKVTKNGYELNGNFYVVQRKPLNWLLLFSYSKNSIELTRKEGFMLITADTTINNKIISLINNFRYSNFELNFEFESKTGYDINLYRNSISVAEPFTYREFTQISEVNNNGIPTTESIDNFNNYITDTDYFILKHAGLEYHIRDKAKSNKYVIGLHYNKMRRMFFYLNDIHEYQEQFQKPSFYNALSLSFKMEF